MSPVSRRELLKFGLAAPALLGVGMLAPDGPQAAAANLRLIDYADRLVPPEQIKAAGFDGALVYVAESRPGGELRLQARHPRIHR